MSITFYCPGAKSSVVQVYDDGFEVSQTPFECNFSNGNARAILGLLNETSYDGMYGAWTVEQQPKVQRQLMVLINKHSDRESARSLPYREGNFIDCGNSDAMVLRRLEALQKLVAFASGQNLNIGWG